MLRVSLYRWALPSFLLFAAFILGCGEGSGERSPCQGFAKKKMGITREEYLPCAGEIMDALERFQPQLKAILRGKKEAVPEAKQTYRELRKLVRETGMALDGTPFRAERAVERWPDLQVRALNNSIQGALAQYGSCLGRPNKGNYQEGSRLHDKARRIYRRIR